MPEKISLFRGTGDNLSSNIVSIFLVPDTGKRYIITTENAVDPHGLTVLHVSEIVDDKLVKVANDEEWTTIKTIMRAIISNNVGSFQYLPLMERAKAEGQYSRDISVSSSAAKQMTDNYISADKIDVVKDEVAKVEEEKANATNSIFPTESVNPTEENEVSPGIADVASPVPQPVALPVAESAPAAEANTSTAIMATPVMATPVVTPQTVQAALPEDTQDTAAQASAPIVTDQVAAAIQGVQAPMATQPMMVNNLAETQQIPVIQNNNLSGTQQIPVVNNLSNTQQIPVVQNNMMYGNVDQQQMYVDQGVGTPMSSFGVTSGYSTMPPMENMYNQMYRNDPMLEQVVLQAQEMMNETVRNIVYMIYDKTKQIPQVGQIQQMYQPMMNTTLYGGMMANQMMQPYAQMMQPQVIQVQNDIQ